MTGEVWKIGAVRISRIVEIEATGGMTRIIPDASRERVLEIPWLQPHFADKEGRMRGAIHALVVETPDRRIVVDTCVGNDKPRSMPFWDNLQTSFLADLATAGYARESIDTVLCTHLHVDHVGWNTMREGERWVPTFPQARYLMGEQEFQYWQKEAEGDQAQVMSDSVTPVFEAGLVDLVASDYVLCPEIRLLATPGHTPGHVSVLIESDGKSALITGDFLHHPCQFVHPEWSSSPDAVPMEAIETRRRMYARFADSPTLVIGTHFATPTAGHLHRDGESYRFEV